MADVSQRFKQNGAIEIPHVKRQVRHVHNRPIRQDHAVAGPRVRMDPTCQAELLVDIQTDLQPFRHEQDFQVQRVKRLSGHRE